MRQAVLLSLATGNFILKATRAFSARESSVCPNLIGLPDALKLFEDEDYAVRFIDGSWYHKGEKNGRTDYLTGPRIPGSVYFDILDLVCPSKLEQGLALMLPPALLVTAWMEAQDIHPQDHLIIYGHEQARFLPRVWFTLDIMQQHGKVSILQASLQEWEQQGCPMETKELDESAIPRAQMLLSERGESFSENDNIEKTIVDADDMLKLLEQRDTIILDARGSSFAKGYMPRAIHIPYSTLSSPPTRLLPSDELLAIFHSKGADPLSEAPIVCTCGSGVSACTIYLSLVECGRDPNTSPIFLYDGSWSEWKTIDSAPKVVPP